MLKYTTLFLLFLIGNLFLKWDQAMLFAQRKPNIIYIYADDCQNVERKRIQNRLGW